MQTPAISSQPVSLFQNSFAPPPSAVFVGLNPGAMLGPWLVGGDGIDHIGTYWQSADGDQASIDLNGPGPGSITTSLSTLSGWTSGATYRVSFSLAANPDNTLSPQSCVRVSTASSQQDYCFNVLNVDGQGTPASSANMGWQRHTFEFTGSPTDHLTFTSLDAPGDGWGPALDHITVEKLVPTTGTGVRHLFTGKERDAETGLDYFGARYMSAAQGRFTSVDPTLESAKVDNPQTWNRYTYALNNPLRFIDPDGQIPVDTILDVASLGMSLRDLVRNPSWAAAGYAAWDLGAAALPYVPGSWVGRVAKYGHQGLEAAGVLKRLDDFEGAVNNRYIKEGVALLGQGDDSVRKVLGLSSADKAADFLGVTQSGKYIIGEAKGSDLASAVAQLGNTAKALTGKLGDVKFSAEVVLRKGQKLDPSFRVSGSQLERFNAKTQKWELQKALDQAINVRYVD